jgi:hypothetical protein
MSRRNACYICGNGTLKTDTYIVSRNAVHQTPLTIYQQFSDDLWSIEYVIYTAEILARDDVWPAVFEKVVL